MLVVSLNKTGFQPISRPVEQPLFKTVNKIAEEGKKECLAKKRPGFQKEKGLAPPSASPYMLKHYTKTDKVRKKGIFDKTFWRKSNSCFENSVSRPVFHR